MSQKNMGLDSQLINAAEKDELIRLVYVSAATNWPTEKELMDILEKARGNNMKRNITGMLIYNNGVYMQLIEGFSKDIHRLYDLMMHDRRHNRIIKLVEESITERYFPDWNMGFKDLSTMSPDELPGFIAVFNGKLDLDTVSKNIPVAIALILNFARK